MTDPRDGTIDPEIGPETRAVGVWPAVAAVSAGGVLGALTRHAAQSAWPRPAAGFGWATFGINVVGCLLIGVLMASLTARRDPHPLVRPFLATGVLGGFTTFSTSIGDTDALFRADRPATALVYLGGTLLAAVAAAWVGAGPLAARR